MGMTISNATGSAGAAHMKPQDSARPSREVQSSEGATQAREPAAGPFLDQFKVLPESRFHKTKSGLMVATVREGAGKPFTAGTKIKVTYTGWLQDGTKFDSSQDHNAPFEFTLGAGRVIKGWEEGLAGIRPGERRQLVIPPSLAYGGREVGNIPPDSTLIFNVEAVAVEEPPPNPNGTMNVVA